MAATSFASSADLGVKEQTLEVLADGVYALTAEGDPNLGAIEGEDFLVCFEALATPVAARRWLAKLREHTDKPVRYLVLSHYHAVRVLGASAFDAHVASLTIGWADHDFKVNIPQDHPMTLRLFGAVDTQLWGYYDRGAFQSEARCRRSPMSRTCTTSAATSGTDRWSDIVDSVSRQSPCPSRIRALTSAGGPSAWSPASTASITD